MAPSYNVELREYSLESAMSESCTMQALWSPSDEHRMLRHTVRDGVRREGEPQGVEPDRAERFNQEWLVK